MVLSAWKAVRSEATVTGEEVHGESNRESSAWKAVRSEATVTGDEVLGESNRESSAWKTVRLWKCFKSLSFGVVPSRHIVPTTLFRALRARLLSLRSVVPSRHLTLKSTQTSYHINIV